MFMFVVYTSRVKGKALLAANEPTAESAAEDGANLGGASWLRRRRWRGEGEVKGGDAATGGKGASGNNLLRAA